MLPRARAEAGFAAAGLLLLAIFGLNVAAWGWQDWTTSAAVQGAGFVVAAAGAAGLAAGRGRGRDALAAGLVVALAGALMALGFTMAWEGRTSLYVLGAALAAACTAQAAWCAVLAASGPASPARLAAGLALGLAVAAVGHGVTALQELLVEVGPVGAARVPVALGLLAAASGTAALLGRGGPDQGAPER